MAQKAAADQEESSMSETEMEFVTADFAELCLIGFGSICLIGLVAALAWYLLFYVPPGEHGGRQRINYTRLLEESINRSVAPCDNFYRFVCSGWIHKHAKNKFSVADSVQKETLLDALDAFEEVAKNHRRRQSAKSWLEGSSEFDDANKTRQEGNVHRQALRDNHATSSVHRQNSESGMLKAALIFESCKDVVDKKRSETEKLAAFMNTYTKFPAVEPQDTTSIIATVVELSLTWRINTLFKVNIFPDADEGGRPTVEIGENVDLFTWFLWRNILKDSGKLEDFFISHLQVLPHFRSARAEQLLTEIADADSQIIPSLQTDEVLPDAVTYHQLHELVPDVVGEAWVDAVNKQTEPYFKVEVGHHVSVANKHYLLQVGKILNYTAKPTLVPTFIGWTLLRQLAPRASYKAASFVYKNKASYIDACFRFVTDVMPLAASYPYLTKAPTARALATAETLTKDIRREFTAIFTNVPWMDNATRAAAVTKMGAMAEVLAKPAFLLDEGVIDEQYANFSTHANYLTASLEAARSSVRLSMKTLSSGKTTVERVTFWPLGVNAYYDVQLNAVFVSAGIMRPPYLDDKAWTAFNYAGLGAVAGHEVMHGFDSRGMNRDKQGKLHNWWSPDALNNYDGKVACLRRAYGVDSRTAEENVADFASLPAVLGAQRHRSFLHDRGKMPTFLEFSREQLFYLNYCFRLCSPEGSLGDARGPRSADEDRCNVPLKNLKEFADAFGCAKRDPMHVADKCSFWDLPVEQVDADDDEIVGYP
ncbi:neprilysin-1-like [Amblyomma americanum]